MADLVVRTDLTRQALPAPTGTRLLTFAQLSDIHLIDEGSPLRTEFLDPWMGTAYRPQEALTPHVLARMTAAIRDARSPITGSGPDLVITTGDNTDTGQANEVRWLIDLLDGGLIDPGSGIPGTCGTDPDGPRSVGWPGEGRGYDPEGATPLASRDAVGGVGRADGPGYAPDAATNAATIGRATVLEDHPGLTAAQDRPFLAGGVGLPWYASFGNHDALVQGNAPLDPRLATLAAGCAKLLALPDALAAGVGEVARTQGRDGLIAMAFSALEGAMAPDPTASWVRRIPGDAGRVPLTKREFIAEHFRTSGSPVGHGFDAGNLAAGEGYYAFDAAPGIRLLALDTVNEAGGHQGNLDTVQAEWLHRELLAADRTGTLVIAFGHHSLQSMTQPAADAHLGGITDATPTAPCAATSPEDPVAAGETVRCLLLRHPSLVALIDGHEHRNRITPHRGAVPGTGFWEITTASHIEWPQEARLIELLATPGGLAIVTRMIQHDAPTAVAPDAPLDDPATLAAIARELSHADPQARNGLDGTQDPAGTPVDRDTLLLLDRAAALVSSR